MGRKKKVHTGVGQLPEMVLDECAISCDFLNSGVFELPRVVQFSHGSDIQHHRVIQVRRRQVRYVLPKRYCQLINYHSALEIILYCILFARTLIT